MPDLSCPRCGATVPDLLAVSPALMAKIKESGNSEELPDHLCEKCLSEVAGKLARGSILMVMEKAKEKQKAVLWKSRVQLIKKAQNGMKTKMFSDAAVAYEKYLRVLELVFDTKPGQLKPEIFKDGAKTKELTIVTNSYWDLVRIYDSNSRYKDRQTEAAKKLVEFIPFTPVYTDIVRKARTFQKTSKNPNLIRGILKDLKAEKRACMIATAVYGNGFHPVVQKLRRFRDLELEPRWAGRVLINVYYFVSPFLIGLFKRFQLLNPPARAFLEALSRRLN